MLEWKNPSDFQRCDSSIDSPGSVVFGCGLLDVVFRCGLLDVVFRCGLLDVVFV
jgi:hypothetical protein